MKTGNLTEKRSKITAHRVLHVLVGGGNEAMAVKLSSEFPYHQRQTTALI